MPTKKNGSISTAAASAWGGVIANALPRRRRSMLEFAESEIIIPNGRYKGEKFKTLIQPYTRLWLELVDTGQFNEFNTTGPVQSGKTLLSFVIPILYYLFEIKEDVIVGIPRQKDAMMKWSKDIFPVIQRMRGEYRDLMPRYGAGSKRGEFTDITFRNSATLVFLSGAGDDEERSGVTGKVLVATEVDKMDEPGAVSRESSPIDQLVARTESYGDDAVIFKECTASITKGEIWTGYKRGTATRILTRCPFCKSWVAPGREDLTGWEDSESELEAGRRAYFKCPSCSEKLDEKIRRQMNRKPIAVHRGQDVSPAGKVLGKRPETRTLGFRWDGWNNLFHTIRHLGAVEWLQRRKLDRESAEKYCYQFIWATPYDGLAIDLTALDPEGISTRTIPFGEGIAPADTLLITAALDVAKRAIHWTAIAWRENGTCHILAYEVFKPRWEFLGVELACLEGLEAIADRLERGFQVVGSDSIMVPRQVWIDSGWQGGKTVEADFVYDFCQSRGRRFNPLKGFGVGQYAGKNYAEPKKRDKTTARKGDGWHASRIQKKGITRWVFMINADHWKSWIHARLATPVGQVGALTLYDTDSRNRHLAISQQLTSERIERTVIPGRGEQIRWIHESGDNHWLDSTCYAAAAANYCGITLTGAGADLEAQTGIENNDYFNQSERGGL